MNADLKSVDLCFAIFTAFFLEKPSLRSILHTVDDDTSTPVADFIAEHTSCKYMDGFSATIPITKSS
jgi:hypothetical protein